MNSLTLGAGALLGPSRPTAKRLQVTEHKLTPDEATAEVVRVLPMGLFWLGQVTHTQTRGDLGMCLFEADPVIYQGGVMGEIFPNYFRLRVVSFVL